MNRELNPILLKIVEQRGIGADELDEFFSPRPQLTYDPFLLTDMRAGVDLLLSEIDEGSRIVVYGDYDADGVTATAVMIKALRCLTDNVTYYIPSRIDEGYGLNKDAIEKIYRDGGEVIITVDCGAVSRAETEYAHALGMRTIITDHHHIGESMAEGIVIDPWREGDRYPFKGLAGVGVAYKFVQALSREREIPRDLRTELLELVTIGTVADIMPLIDENRTIVKYGLRLIRMGCFNKGLRRLLERADLKYDKFKASGISFGVAPRINAAGRIGDASLGVQLFLSESDEEIDLLCTKLIDANDKRKALQDAAYEQCIDKARSELEHGDFIMVEAVGAHEGVLGIVAGKIKEELSRPVLIVSRNGEDFKGTGRSVSGVDLFEMLNRYKDVFTRFGGHSAACGFLIPEDRLEQLREDLNRDLAEMSGGDEKFFEEEIVVDADICPDDVTLEFAEELEMLEPCGQGNREPKFAFHDVIIDQWTYLGGSTKYARLRIGGIDCVLFHDAEEYHKIYEARMPVTVIGDINVHEWSRSRSAQVVINRIIV